MSFAIVVLFIGMSSPARGTWIEMAIVYPSSAKARVVPRKGDVDRNWTMPRRPVAAGVVPRKGDVDRNNGRLPYVRQTLPVVPRKGDVDRNAVSCPLPLMASTVVPRKGDVDRNIVGVAVVVGQGGSSPARGTWIEMRTPRRLSLMRMSSPARGTWIEIGEAEADTETVYESSPARGTWIEMRTSMFRAAAA